MLIKSEDLSKVCIFEFDTIRYEETDYLWRWNKNKNLEGLHKQSQTHLFTWQPHGSQFTIIEPVPKQCLLVAVKPPQRLGFEQTLVSLGYTDDWVTVRHR